MLVGVCARGSGLGEETLLQRGGERRGGDGLGKGVLRVLRVGRGREGGMRDWVGRERVVVGVSEQQGGK